MPPSRATLPVLLILGLAVLACGDSGDSSPKRVFVTSGVYSGSLAFDDPDAGEVTGVAAGDAICQQLADDASLGGTWLAWLSDETTSPAADFHRTSGEYKLVDDTVIANGWDDLTDDKLEAPISLDENGQPAPASDAICAGETAWVLTGTSNRGQWATSLEDCDGWTSDTGAGTWGRSDRIEFWSEACSGGEAVDLCSLQGPIFCFEQ